MALTLDVLPGNATIPTFGQLAAWSTERVNWMLAQRGIARTTRVVARCTDDENDPVDVPPERPFTWSPVGYAWFVLDGAEGGVDVTVLSELDELMSEYLPQPGDEVTFPQQVLQHAVSLDRAWTFRTSMGQPPLVRFAQGVLAGTLAEITSGIVDSADGAAPLELLPAVPGDLYSWWMNPTVPWEDQPFWAGLVADLQAGL